jgi:hypothetical protein
MHRDTKQQKTQPPLWLRRLDRSSERQPTAQARLGSAARLDLAMVLMADGLLHLEERAKGHGPGRDTKPRSVDQMLRRFAELDHRWTRAKGL